MLLFLFTLLGMGSRKCVEICCGVGSESNSANLIINHGWNGLLIDGRQENIQAANELFRSNPSTRHWPPDCRCQWVTAENINALLESSGYSDNLDLLTIDVDGVDYWLWSALTVARPRVVVIEVNYRLGKNEAKTVPYKPDFVGKFSQYGSVYGGASLPALIQLGKSKGYHLVGTNRYCTNAFFLRDDLRTDNLPEPDIETCFDHPRVAWISKADSEAVGSGDWIAV